MLSVLIFSNWLSGTLVQCQSLDTVQLNAMQYRCIGPYRGGRSCAVVGVNDQRNVFYMGATGGGVFKTTDGGSNWKNVSDGYFGGSIGAIAISNTDKDVIYVGQGEQTVRGNVSEGFGMWKSTDAGRTWLACGLTDTRHINKIVIHPKNADVVYVAALGHLFGKNTERGIFKTTDGGKSWKKILYVNDSVGASDICMDPNNPMILYAGMWHVKRTPYSFESGGPGSGLYKSIDGGETWKNISGSDGLPTDTLGIVMIAVSPVNSNRVWAMIEAPEGGLFKSDDGGQSFSRINDERKIRQRAWYYSRIFADTKNQNTVYALNVEFYKSTDSGKNFKAISTPHADHHDLWIDPIDNQRMIVADDGGAQISFDGGDNWSTYYNQPTMQFYRVNTDNHFPYRIYGAQQDNSSIRILSRSNNQSITNNDWENTAGGESGHHAIDPTNDNIVYGGNYGGYLERLNHLTGESRNVSVWPDSPIGWGADSLKYRFQWNFPVFFSPHQKNKLYAAGNQLFTSNNEGQSWTAISPDLTRNNKSTQRASGGIITKDNTTVEYYATIFAAVESAYEPNLLWCGSDDGLIHVSKNGGANWLNVTPANLPKWVLINQIEVDPFNKGGLYVAATNYKNDDFKPYLLHTTDYGKTWQAITNGINNMHFTRVIKADPKRKGLLYAGTEYGMYISFNDGKNWQTFQQNLPIVPITDLAIKDDDLIVATQGRSFWILDNLTLLHQMEAMDMQQKIKLYKPRNTYLFQHGYTAKPVNAGANPQAGVEIPFYLKTIEKSTTVTIHVLYADTVIKSFNSQASTESDKWKLKQGLNKVVWDMTYPEAYKFDGMVTWAGTGGKVLACPGNYKVRLISGMDTLSTGFELLKVPYWDATDADLKARTDFLLACRNKLTETNKSITNIRDIRYQLNTVSKRMDAATIDSTERIKIEDEKRAIEKKLAVIEETLYQTRTRAVQDVLNFPIKLNDKLADLMNNVSQGNTAPSQQAKDFYNEIATQIDLQLHAFNNLIKNDIKQFNTHVNAAQVPAVQLQPIK